LHNIGDIYEIDGQKFKITDVKTVTNDGSTVTTETAEPVEEGQK
jgi:hypothetical protein